MLGPARQCDTENFVLLTGDPNLAQLEVSQAVFLDTETTGLSGGAGVFVYMVGLARFVEEGVEVWQGFMDGPEEESALLTEVARRIEGSGGVVSFFGKSFDRHRLQDKMALHGISSPFQDKPHLDLYHPLRRLHRDVFENHKLQTMGRALCGMVRPDDLPGSLAPEAWFDYLAGRPHRLEGVFRHNSDDVLSLITLMDWLARVDQREWVTEDVALEVQRELALAQSL
ncbi:MAG: ribonuclease H-like domain-containing protein, partial [Planctomycetes bacterium]|nr:ribonuclease H-like domain-containing protein [Planctomycetota bacterium]